MKRWVAVCAVVLAMGPMMRAQTTDAAVPDAAKVAKVQQMFEVMHMDRMMSQLMTAMGGAMQQMVRTMPGADQMNEQQKALMDEFMKQGMQLVTDTMSWKSMEPEYVKIYATAFTTQEIDAIIAFYQTSAGQSMLEKTPMLTQAGMKIAQGRMVELEPKLKALQDEFIPKMVAAGTTAVQPK
ncbi:MAG: DUF2059 domain-containing protein [Acidobacteriaceae bacterium]